MIRPEKPNQPRQQPGVVKRRELRALMQKLAPILGFNLSSDDIIGARETGSSTVVQRKRHLPRPIPPTITLYLDIQYKWAEEFYCTGIFSSSALTYYSSYTQVSHYANGDITTTVTQPSPGPHLWNPDNPTLYSCASTTTSDDRVPGFDYGALITTDAPSYSGALNPADLLTAAIANVANDGSPTTPITRSWVSGTGTPTGLSQYLGYWTDDGAPYSRRLVKRYDYRWRVEGGVGLHIEWTQGGTSHTLDIGGAATSSWYNDELPTLMGSANADRITAVTITEAP